MAVFVRPFTSIYATTTEALQNYPTARYINIETYLWSKIYIKPNLYYIPLYTLVVRNKLTNLLLYLII